MTVEYKTLKVVGNQTIHCGSCENTIKFTLKQLPGLRQVKASYKTQLIELIFDQQELDLKQIEQKLDWVGYQVVELQEQ